MADTAISKMPDASPLVGTEFIPLVQNGINVKSTVSLAMVRTQRLVIVSPITVLPTDRIINCKIPTIAACTLPIAASRGGLSLTFKDLGQAAANAITLTAAGTDTIDGQPSIKINNNYQSITLIPLSDGTSTGWAVA